MHSCFGLIRCWQHLWCFAIIVLGSSWRVFPVVMDPGMVLKRWLSKFQQLWVSHGTILMSFPSGESARLCSRFEHYDDAMCSCSSAQSSSQQAHRTNATKLAFPWCIMVEVSVHCFPFGQWPDCHLSKPVAHRIGNNIAFHASYGVPNVCQVNNCTIDNWLALHSL